MHFIQQTNDSFFFRDSRSPGGFPLILVQPGCQFCSPPLSHSLPARWPALKQRNSHPLARSQLYPAKRRNWNRIRRSVLLDHPRRQYEAPFSRQFFHSLCSCFRRFVPCPWNSQKVKLLSCIFKTRQLWNFNENDLRTGKLYLIVEILKLKSFQKQKPLTAFD